MFLSFIVVDVLVVDDDVAVMQLMFESENFLCSQMKIHDAAAASVEVHEWKRRRLMKRRAYECTSELKCWENFKLTFAVRFWINIPAASKP